MTPARFMQEARDLDAAIQALDRRLFWARHNNAPTRSLDHIIAQRNALARQWGATWQTRPVQ